MSLHRQMSRSAVIGHFYEQARHNDRRATIDNITRDALDSYIDATAPQFRRVKLTLGADDANAKKLDRWLTGKSGDLPADLEEHVVNALPEPYRSDCIRELSARYGLLAVQTPEAGAAGKYRGIGCVMRETGEFIHVCAADPQSPAEIDRAIKEGEEAVAAMLSYIEALREKRRSPVLKVAQ